ncbi:MAG TPA: ATP-binding protein [Candidatus Margulisiibacteriota bacterium]|nr:ATP-binding protein [Candidatus Margulisiibacteriota bacterium]
MNLRAKLLLAQAPLAVALVAVGIFATATMSRLGQNADAILKDNYRSVLAIQRMQEATERMQDGAALLLIGGADESAVVRAAKQRHLFESELRVQENNITEPGELEGTRRLRHAWTAYQEAFDRLQQLHDPPAARAFFFATLDPAFTAVKQAAETILSMNQDAMVQKSERARREADRMNTVMLLGSLIALLAGGLASATMTTRLVEPLALLTRTVNRIGEGDFETRANVTGSDELAQLAGNINSMAARLSQYRRSSLGELLLAQQASQAAIESLPDPVVVFDVNGAILNVNHAAETLLAIGVDPMGGDPLAAADSEVRAVLERVRGHVLAGKGSYVPRGFDEALCIKAPEGERYLLPRATPVYAEQGGVAGATVVLQDVTRLRRVDELRNDLVATVAHEFRTPLTSLRMAIHLCIEQTAGPLTEKQADLLYAAREDCERLQSMVDELLDLARIQGGRVELQQRPTPPDALVAAAVDAYRGAADEMSVTVEMRVLPGLNDVSVDRERIQLVLSNLLSNALRHTPTGGRVEVRARADDGRVRFEVADTGPGIPKEFQQSVFEKFFRIPGVASGGAGIGLSISKEIVEAHGGEIGVESEPGHGCTFWFTVPVAAMSSDH